MLGSLTNKQKIKLGLAGVAVLVLRYDNHRKLLQAVVYFVKGKDRGNYFELTNDKILG